MHEPGPTCRFRCRGLRRDRLCGGGADRLGRARPCGATAHARRARTARHRAALAAERLVSAANETSARRRPSLLILLPLAVFLALAGLFFYRLGSGDPSMLPSALIGRPVPQPEFPPLARLGRHR